MKTEVSPHEMIVRAVCASTPWFLDAEVQARPQGWAALIRLNPTMAKVRATEQGLADRSVAAAAKDTGVRQMWDAYIARANALLPADVQIVDYTPVFDEPAGAQ
jgi:hypothetical protein